MTPADDISALFKQLGASAQTYREFTTHIDRRPSTVPQIAMAARAVPAADINIAHEAANAGTMLATLFGQLLASAPPAQHEADSSLSSIFTRLTVKE